jgi:hypothetical protein
MVRMANLNFLMLYIPLYLFDSQALFVAFINIFLVTAPKQYKTKRLFLYFYRKSLFAYSLYTLLVCYSIRRRRLLQQPLPLYQIVLRAMGDREIR